MSALTPAQHAALEAFARAVETSPHNLVSKQARAELASRHVPESVSFAELVPPGPARVLDIGSGGGFPGVVVAIVRPDLQVELLDSTRKKTTFLREVTGALGLEVVVHTGRAEELGRADLGGSFDVVTARAVAALDRLAELAIPFLRPGGVLMAIKGARWAEELDVAQGALRRLGARVASTPADRAGSDGDPPAPRVVSIVRT